MAEGSGGERDRESDRCRKKGSSLTINSGCAFVSFFPFSVLAATCSECNDMSYCLIIASVK